MVQTIFAGAADADKRPGNMLKIDRKIFAAEMQIGMVGAIPGPGCHLAGEVGPAGVVDQRRRAGVPEDVNLRAKGAGETGGNLADRALTRCCTSLLWVRSVPPARRSPAARSGIASPIRVTLSTTESRVFTSRLATLCSTVTSWLASRIASLPSCGRAACAPSRSL